MIARVLDRIRRTVTGAPPASKSPLNPMYQPKRVRLFIKSYCSWCSQAMDWLDRHGIRYERLDVLQDDAAYAEMLRLSGQTAAPVIDVDGRVLANFSARELDAFWRTLAAEAA